MPAITPFTGLLYDARLLGPGSSLTAPPYDTVGIDARRALATDPHNVVHIDLSEERPGDDEHDNKYTRAASLLETWRRSRVLRPTPVPSTFVYEMRFELDGAPRSIRGLIATVELTPWGEGVLPHEEVMPGPVEDRLRLLRALRANVSPVYALYPGPRPALTAALDEAARTLPAIEVTDGSGTRHRLWTRPGPAPDPPSDDVLLVADGHHRYTTALRYRDEMGSAHGPGPWDRLMMLLVDGATEDPPVLPIHRVGTADPPGDVELRPARNRAEATRALSDGPVPTIAVLTSDEGRGGGEPIWHTLVLHGPAPAVRALHQVPGFARQVEQGEIRFTHDAQEAEHAVRAGAARTAYLLPPTTPERIRDVVATGRRMPQKSTFFWPKPRTGMVLRPLEV
ncbi:MAG: DUF1015 domain-containing protein [Actinomycetota bacterium]